MRTTCGPLIFASAVIFVSASASAETIQALGPQQGKQVAIQSHSQIQAATALALRAEAQAREVLATDYPNNLAGAEALNTGGIGATAIDPPGEE